MAQIPLRFPVDALPTWQAAFVREVAKFTETTEDAVAMMSLAVLSAAVAKKARVVLDRRRTFPLNLWIVVGMTSGDRKSGLFGFTVAPLQEVDRLVRLPPESLEEGARPSVYDLIGGRPPSATPVRVARSIQQRLSRILPQSTPRLLVTGATAIGLQEMLIEQGEQLALLSDEGGFLVALKETSDLDAILKAHDGGHTFIRLGNGEQRELRDPTVTIGFIVQPHVLNKLVRNETLFDRGVVGRFLFAVPPTMLGVRQHEIVEIDESVLETYGANVRAMMMLGWNDDDDGTIPFPIQVSDEARQLLAQFDKELEPRIHPERGDLGDIGGWVSKLQGGVKRLVGVLHLAELARSRGNHAYDLPVPATTVRHALAIGRYLLSQACTLLEVHEDVTRAELLEETAADILKWLATSRRDAPGAEFSTSEVQRGVRRPAEVLKAALNLLVEREHLEELPMGRRRRGRPGPKYRRVYRPPPGLKIDGS